jgi:hypothetical protein
MYKNLYTNWVLLIFTIYFHNIRGAPSENHWSRGTEECHTNSNEESRSLVFMFESGTSHSVNSYTATFALSWQNIPKAFKIHEQQYNSSKL